MKTLRELFRQQVASAQSLDENGYITTKDAVLKAFDRAVLAYAQDLVREQIETQEAEHNGSKKRLDEDDDGW